MTGEVRSVEQYVCFCVRPGLIDAIEVATVVRRPCRLSTVGRQVFVDVAVAEVAAVEQYVCFCARPAFADVIEVPAVVQRSRRLSVVGRQVFVDVIIGVVKSVEQYVCFRVRPGFPDDTVVADGVVCWSDVYRLPVVVNDGLYGTIFLDVKRE